MAGEITKKELSKTLSNDIMFKSDNNETLTSIKNDTEEIKSSLDEKTNTIQNSISDLSTDINEHMSAFTSERAAKIDNLDTTISSRAPASTALSKTVWTDTRAGSIDTIKTNTSKIDANVSSRAPASTALSNATWTDDRAENLDNLDTTISSRAPASTALSNATWTNTRASHIDTIKTNTDKIDGIKSTIGSTGDTNGSNTGGSIMGKLNKVINNTTNVNTINSNVNNVNTKVSSIQTTIGDADDTGGSTTDGSVMGKLNKAISNTNSIGTINTNINTIDNNIDTINTKTTNIETKIGATADTGGSSTTGSLMSKINKLLSDLSSHISLFNSTRASKIDKIDANISSRAPANTALSTSIWTSARASAIDTIKTNTNDIISSLVKLDINDSIQNKTISNHGAYSWSKNIDNTDIILDKFIAPITGIYKFEMDYIWNLSNSNADGSYTISRYWDKSDITHTYSIYKSVSVGSDFNGDTNYKTEIFSFPKRAEIQKRYEGEFYCKKGDPVIICIDNITYFSSESDKILSFSIKY